MKAGGLQTNRTIGTLWSWTYKSRDREGAHIQNKMADAIDDLLLWGDDFEVILDILEGDETVEQQFEEATINVSSNCANSCFEFIATDPKRSLAYIFVAHRVLA